MADVSVGDVWRQHDQTTGLSINLISPVKSLVELPGTKYLCLAGKMGSSIFYLQLSSQTNSPPICLISRVSG